MCLCLCAQCRSPVWCVRRCSGRETLWGDTNALMLYRNRFCCVPVRAVRLISPPRLTCSITFERFISSCCRTAALSPAAAKPSPCVWVVHIAHVFVRFWRVELLTAGLRVTVLTGKSRPSHGTSWPWNGQIQGERSLVQSSVCSLWLSADGLMFGVHGTLQPFTRVVFQHRHKRSSKSWQKRLEGQNRRPLIEDVSQLFSLRVNIGHKVKCEANLTGLFNERKIPHRIDPEVNLRDLFSIKQAERK